MTLTLAQLEVVLRRCEQASTVDELLRYLASWLAPAVEVVALQNNQPRQMLVCVAGADAMATSKVRRSLCGARPVARYRKTALMLGPQTLLLFGKRALDPKLRVLLHLATPRLGRLLARQRDALQLDAEVEGLRTALELDRRARLLFDGHGTLLAQTSRATDLLVGDGRDAAGVLQRLWSATTDGERRLPRACQLDGMQQVVLQVRHRRNGQAWRVVTLEPATSCRLSPRQSEILMLAGRGIGNAEIAKALDLSINTVKTQLKIAYRRLGIRRRSEVPEWLVTTDMLVDQARAF